MSIDGPPEAQLLDNIAYDPLLTHVDRQVAEPFLDATNNRFNSIRHGRSLARIIASTATAKDVGEGCYVTIVYQTGPTGVLGPEPSDHLSPYDVDLTVKKTSALRDLLLFVREVRRKRLQVLVAVRLDIDKAFKRSVIQRAHTPTIAASLNTFNLR